MRPPAPTVGPWQAASRAPSGGRYLIVNADDLGMSRGVNRGILEAHERGIVTSASLLVCWPAAEDAVAAAARFPDLDLGLHIDLGEWRWDGDGWRTVYERVPAGDATAVAAEIERQLARFRLLTGRDPSHLDSHQHVHLHEPALGVTAALARRLRAPFRGRTPGLRHCGSFHGQTGKGERLPEAIGVDALIDILEALPVGTTELGCHPGADIEPGPGYRAERVAETRTLCDPRVRAAIDANFITLCNFADARSSAWTDEPASATTSTSG